MDNYNLFPPSENKDERPPRPKGWTLTLADLAREQEAGKRPTGPHDLEWARAYERSLFQPGMRLPQSGDVYRALEALEVYFTFEWGWVAGGDGHAQLEKGDTLWVEAEPLDPKLGLPLRAFDPALEDRIVESSDREFKTNRGFRFHVSTVDLNRKFTLVRTDYVKLFVR